MKKIITVIAFFAITLLGTNVSFGQESDSNKLSANAKMYTHDLSKVLKMDGAAQRVIYNAHMLRNRKINTLTTKANDYRAIEKGGELSPKADKIMSEFNAKVKSVLTEEQFAEYQKIKPKKKA